ncbi:MAG: ABC transporter ATP-binding protein, partial [Bacteroidales bacterium]
TIVFVTHNPELAKFSTRTITLRDGHIIGDAENDHIESAKAVLDTLPVDDQQ